ncbi:cell wall-binding repeat-containing protein [Clostridium sp. LBM24168]
MLNKRIKAIIISVTVCTTLLFSGTVFADGSIQTERLSGQDRYGTNTAIIDKGWVKTQSVILVNSRMYADAIVSAPLSKKYIAPILLTDGNVLSRTARDKIQSLSAKNIYIIGGTGVISSNIENDLKSQRYNVVRIAGQTRYDTSVQVAKQLGGNNDVFVVDGDKWEDALSIAPVAANQQSPILLANKDSAVDSVKFYPVENGLRTITVVGDNNFIRSNGIINSYGSFFTISGNNSLDVNKAIIDKYKDKLDFVKVFLASDSTFADALSGSALAALNNNPIVLVDNNNQDNAKSTVDNNKSNIKTISVLGGTGVISDILVNNIVNNTNNNSNNSGNSSNTNTSTIPNYYSSLHSNSKGQLTNFSDTALVQAVFNNDIVQLLNNGFDTISNVEITQFLDFIKPLGKTDQIITFLEQAVSEADYVSTNVDSHKGIVMLGYKTTNSFLPISNVTIEYNKDSNTLELYMQTLPTIPKDILYSLRDNILPIFSNDKITLFNQCLDIEQDNINQLQTRQSEMLNLINTSKKMNTLLYTGLNKQSQNYGTIINGIYANTTSLNTFIVLIK